MPHIPERPIKDESDIIRIKKAPKPILMPSRLYPRSRRYRIREHKGIFRPQERRRKYFDWRKILPIYHWYSYEPFTDIGDAREWIDLQIKNRYSPPAETIHPYYSLAQNL